MRMEMRQHYSDGEFDRADERRQDAAWITGRLLDASSRIYPLSGGKHLIANAAPVTLDHDAAVAAGGMDDVVLLGVKDGVAHFSFSVGGGDGLAARHDAAWHDLRDVAEDLPCHAADHSLWRTWWDHMPEVVPDFVPRPRRNDVRDL